MFKTDSQAMPLPDATSVFGVLPIETFLSHLIQIDIQTPQSATLILVVDGVQRTVAIVLRPIVGDTQHATLVGDQKSSDRS